MVGVFGIIAYSVQQRMREFGVRIALGATHANVLGLVLAVRRGWSASAPRSGSSAAALLAQSISAFLFGVQPLDPMTFVSVAVVLPLTATVLRLCLRCARHASIRSRRSEMSSAVPGSMFLVPGSCSEFGSSSKFRVRGSSRT